MAIMTMARSALGAAAILTLAANAAIAQQPGRIRGQIEKADSGVMVLKTREGAMAQRESRRQIARDRAG